MLRSKVFLRKTRKGGIIKIVREHYLRDDIWCGSAVCDQCDHEKTVLTESPGLKSNLCGCQHYIIPDTNVVLHQVCFFWYLDMVMTVVSVGKSWW